MEDKEINKHFQVSQQLGTLLLLVIAVVAVIAVSKSARSTNPIINENFNLPGQSSSTEQVQEAIVDENEFYSISAKIPNEKFDKENIMKNEILAGVALRQQEWKLGGEAHQFEEELSLEFPDRPIMKYEYLSDYSKTPSQKMGTVSYLVTTYEFTGGAHGMSFPTTYSFNQDGQVHIEELIDIREPQKQIELTKILATKLKQELGEMYDTDMLNIGLGLSYLNEQGQFDSALCDCGDFTPQDNFDNFIITDEGVTFIFAPYQVAAYAAGMPEVRLTWEELAPYLFTTSSKY